MLWKVWVTRRGRFGWCFFLFPLGMQRFEGWGVYKFVKGRDKVTNHSLFSSEGEAKTRKHRFTVRGKLSMTWGVRFSHRGAAYMELAARRRGRGKYNWYFKGTWTSRRLRNVCRRMTWVLASESSSVCHLVSMGMLNWRPISVLYDSKIR